MRTLHWRNATDHLRQTRQTRQTRQKLRQGQPRLPKIFQENFSFISQVDNWNILKRGSFGGKNFSSTAETISSSMIDQSGISRATWERAELIESACGPVLNDLDLNKFNWVDCRS